MNKNFQLNKRVVIITGGLGLLGQKHVEVVAENGGIPVIIDINGLGYFICMVRDNPKAH